MSDFVLAKSSAKKELPNLQLFVRRSGIDQYKRQEVSTTDRGYPRSK
jgi:hypothetical protein